jgi:hypothetical protein
MVKEGLEFALAYLCKILFFAKHCYFSCYVRINVSLTWPLPRNGFLTQGDAVELDGSPSL